MLYIHSHNSLFPFFISGKILDSILDVTVAYPKTKIQNELQTLRGNYPEEIHIFVKDYPIDTLPSDDDELEEWCRKIWAEKEERLERFYQNKNFDAEEEVKSGLVKNWDPLSESAVRSTLYKIIVFWVVFLVLSFLCIALYPMFRLFVVIGCATYIIIGIRRGGVDYVIYRAVRHYES